MTDITKKSSHEKVIQLKGLDGSNPLAFLAALGTLRILNQAAETENIKMGWTQAGGNWNPLLHSDSYMDKDELVQILFNNAPNPINLLSHELLQKTAVTAKSWTNTLKFPYEAYRQYCRNAIKESNFSKREKTDAAAALGSDSTYITDKKVKRVKKTSLDFTAGNQSILKMMEEVVEQTKPAEIKQTLFNGFKYSKEITSLRWDPLDEKRQYALQAVDPTNSSGNPIQADAGANRLAIAGILELPLVPVGKRTNTIGIGFSKRGKYWVWPIWDKAISMDAVRSILKSFLSSIDSQSGKKSLRHRGIVQVYRSWIVMPSGRYRCFTPSDVLL